ncbi:hypothetical protein KBI52_15035 [Microvirga sp. HBU67558]|uniref:hypothetical protein n=1 Tax=Microvirga TaxID=186650 RepID=UPI001B381D62|nr:MULTISPECIES: hypothetical protein [unclassified Microvirga]MBQ0821514.1 hypothetical protein [Microvirga sp. HBU67558]
MAITYGHGAGVSLGPAPAGTGEMAMMPAHLATDHHPLIRRLESIFSPKDDER